MTDIGAKVLALVNEVIKERGCVPRMMIYRETNIEDEALYRAIEQHEAFKQKVSDAVVDTEEKYGAVIRDNFGHFIIPKPKPDPLVEVAESLGFYNTSAQLWAGDLRAALEAFGLEIREKGQ